MQTKQWHPPAYQKWLHIIIRRLDDAVFSWDRNTKMLVCKLLPAIHLFSCIRIFST